MNRLDLELLMQGTRWIPAECDLSVAAGLRRFARNVTPSHSLTSHRYSAWKLIATYADGPLDAYLRAAGNLLSHPEYLRGFRLSTVGRLPPMYTATPSGQRDVPVIGNHPCTCPRGVPEIDWQLENIELWRANLQAILDHLPANDWVPAYLSIADWNTMEWLDAVPFGDGHQLVSESYDGLGIGRPPPIVRLRATLDAIRYFLGFMSVLRPRVGKNNDAKRQANGDERWEASRLLDSTTHHAELSYCELCWRPTIRSQRLEGQVDPYFRERGATDRFCSVHDPSDPTSSYQMDRHYRQLLEHELRAMHGHDSSAYGIRLDCPINADKGTVRKTVYDLIHAFPLRRPLIAFKDLSLAERVFLSRQRGQRNIEIAHELGVSKQAVSKAWKKLAALGAARANEKRVYPDTHEAFTLTDGRSSKLFADVRRLRKQGATTAQIASQLHYFKHTIKAVCLRLDDPAMPS